MSLLYLYRFKFAVKLQIILFENAIIGHFATRAVSGQFWPCCWGHIIKEGTPECRNTGMPEHRNAGIPEYRKIVFILTES